ncbi:MAG: serine hydrolase [Bacteroidia bacterium]|nr:serine hydrolase [Bacteroidia bacterium]
MKKNVSLWLFLFLSVLLILPGCKVGRFFWYNFSDITDYKIFPSRPLHGSDQPFRFIDAQHNKALEQRIHIINHSGDTLGFSEFLEKSSTVAFLIIRNDSLLYERYLDNYDTSSIVASFSMAKSFVSALIGIAIADGQITSENDPVTRYVTELKGRSGWDKVTLHDLLQMSSGVRFSEGYYTPFSGAASYYYGRTLRRSIAHLKTEKPPMSGFDYKSVNSELLGLVIERATGMTLTAYLDEKIWKPLHMEYDASWSIDRKNNGIEKAFCCINARARDFAKFGRLYLHDGNWQGKQIVPEDWVKKSTTVNSEPGGAPFYNHQWWVGAANEGDYSAVGHLGQYIYVYPSKNLIIVRLGTSRQKENWMAVLRQVAHQM